MFDFELVSIGRLLLAVVLGGLVGLERQIHGRPAGLRTHALVCLGSALILVVSQSLGPNVDSGRAVAGIVTGVGFLGAGVIVKSREIVRGLTTAACIWFVAALGIAVGQGLYAIAAASTAISIGVLMLLAWFAPRLPSVIYDCVHVGGCASDIDIIESKCREQLRLNGFRVVGLSNRLDKQANTASLTLRLRARKAGKTVDLSRLLIAIPEVNDVSWGE